MDENAPLLCGVSAAAEPVGENAPGASSRRETPVSNTFRFRCTAVLVTALVTLGVFAMTATTAPTAAVLGEA